MPFHCSGVMHLLFSNTRWLSVLCMLCIITFLLLSLSPGNARMSRGFLLIMLSDTQVMKTHSYTDTAPNLMFWCLNLPSLHFFLWSHEQWIKYTVITKVRHRFTLAGVKEHLRRFKNKHYAMSFLIYISQFWSFFFVFWWHRKDFN